VDAKTGTAIYFAMADVWLIKIGEMKINVKQASADVTSPQRTFDYQLDSEQHNHSPF